MGLTIFFAVWTGFVVLLLRSKGGDPDDPNRDDGFSGGQTLPPMAKSIHVE